MKNKYSLNQRIPDASQDSGWVVKHKGRTYTTWHRTMVIDEGTDISRMIKYMMEINDYPGWTGIDHAVGYSKGQKIVLVSTYDSGD